MNRHLHTPKTILISHVYSHDNKGDAALTSVLIADLKRRFPRARLQIVTLEPPTAKSAFEGVREKPAFMYYALSKYHNPLLKLLYTLYMIPATLLWAVWYRRTGTALHLPHALREVAMAYAAADLIVGVGGGYIRSRKGLMHRLNIPLILHPLLFAHLLGKPTVLYSQSVGPFVHWYEGPMVAFVLRRMTLILLREDISQKLLAGLGVSQNVVRAVDAGFLLQSKEVVDLHARYNIAKDKLIIGVTVRSWLGGEAQKKYEKAVATALDYMIENYHAHVIFVPQVTAAKGDDDRTASQRTQEYMRHQSAATVIVDEPDHHEIKALYNGLDVLLGTRFHSVIFSLTSFVPVVAIEYEHKTSGIMRDLQLTDWVIGIEDVTSDSLVRLLEQLLRQQSVYKAHLKKHIPPYVERAQHTVDVLAERYALHRQQHPSED